MPISGSLSRRLVLWPPAPDTRLARRQGYPSSLAPLESASALDVMAPTPPVAPRLRADRLKPGLQPRCGRITHGVFRRILLTKGVLPPTALQLVKVPAIVPPEGGFVAVALAIAEESGQNARVLRLGKKVRERNALGIKHGEATRLRVLFQGDQFPGRE